MVPRQIAPGCSRAIQRSPAYLGRMARWTRANVDRVAGLYVSPLDPAATQYLVNAVVTAVGRYAVDGVFLDAVEFPGEDFDYSRHAMDLFRMRMRGAMCPPNAHDSTRLRRSILSHTPKSFRTSGGTLESPR